MRIWHVAVSSAWIRLHPKQTEACTRASSTDGGDVSNERVPGQQFSSFSCMSDLTSPPVASVYLLNHVLSLWM